MFDSAIKKFFTVLALTALVGFARPASADTITLTMSLSDPYALGMVVNGLTGSGGQENRDALMVTTLLAETTPVTDPVYTEPGAPPPGFIDTYTRSSNLFSSLPTPTTTGVVTSASSGGATFVGDITRITLGTGFTYLVATYDGTNAGTMIWNISSLAAGTVLEFDRYALPSTSDPTLLVSGAGQDKHQLTHWSLLSPVPDSGTTSMLLGVALLGLGYVRRFLA